MDFNYQFDEYSESFFPGRDYCLLGNGLLQATVQLKGNFGASGNGILLNLISADEYRSRRFWLLAHHAFKEIPTCTALLVGGRLFCADSRQVGTPSMRYRLSFADGAPAMEITWDVRHELDRSLTPRISDGQIEDVALAPGNIALVGEEQPPEAPPSLRVTERIWCPAGTAALVRELTIKNTGRDPLDRVTPWFFVAPNKLFLPSARTAAAENAVVAGYWGGAPQFLALTALGADARTLLAEYPAAVDAALGASGVARDHVDNPFWGPHLAAAAPARAIASGASTTATFVLEYGADEAAALDAVSAARRGGATSLRASTVAEARKAARVSMGVADLDELYEAAKAGIRASASRGAKPGRMNSGILQYDTEWSRDVDFVAAAAAMNGQSEIARDILVYALENLCDDRGHCFCGAAWGGRDLDYQIDTNGIRLWSHWVYLAHTGDEQVVREHWTRLRALVEAFFDPARWNDDLGLIASSRDCWERWRNCGLLPGYELHHQTWSTVGLAKAADLAALVGDTALAERCRAASRRIWDAVLSSRRFTFVRDGRFIKRRTLKGPVQETAFAYRGARTGLLEPDASELQPILTGLVDGRSRLARATLDAMKPLWNQDRLWSHGGYTRYNITSDPDQSSGPWPGVTLMVARAAALAGRWATFEKALSWVACVSRPTWTPFEHFDFAAPDRTNRRWYRGGIIPWLAYAEPSMLVIHDLLGYRPDLASIRLGPNLPPSVRRVKADLRYRGHTIALEIVNGGGTLSSARVDGRNLAHDGRSIELPPLEHDVRVRMTYARAR